VRRKIRNKEREGWEDWEEKDKGSRRIRDYAREGRTGKKRIK